MSFSRKLGLVGLCQAAILCWGWIQPPTANAALASMTVAFQDLSGRPIQIGAASWRTDDGRASSASDRPVSAAGLVTFPYAQVGVGSVSIARGYLSDGSNVNATWRNVQLGQSGITVLRLHLQPKYVRLEAKVRFPDGSPVLGGTVSQTGVYGLAAECDESFFALFSYDPTLGGEVLKECPGVHPPESTLSTDDQGSALIEGYQISPSVSANANYIDSELSQTSNTYELNSAQVNVITLDYMPIINVPSSALVAATNDVVAIGVSVEQPSLGLRPILRGNSRALAGVPVSIGGDGAALLKKCGKKHIPTVLSARTDSLGHATLKVCAQQSVNYRVKGAGAVSSRAVKLRVKDAAPTAVRGIAAASEGANRVRLVWAPPEYTGNASVSTYKVTAFGGNDVRTYILKPGAEAFRKRSLLLTGLTANMRWDFAVQATTRYGLSKVALTPRPVIVGG